MHARVRRLAIAALAAILVASVVPTSTLAAYDGFCSAGNGVKHHMFVNKINTDPAPSGSGTVGMMRGAVMKIHIGDHRSVNLCDGSPSNGQSYILLSLQQDSGPEGMIQIGVGRADTYDDNSGPWRFYKTTSDHQHGVIAPWSGANNALDVEVSSDYEFSIEKDTDGACRFGDCVPTT